MNTTTPKKNQRTSPTKYRITVNGTITENWKDWFNGMLIDFEPNQAEVPQTAITCQVRDQAELNGILNWLHNLNLPLVEVIKIEP